MGKWFILLLVLALLVGFYWMIGSGTFADRNIHMQLQNAATVGTAEQIQSSMDSIKAQVDSQREWIQRLRFIARNPDMTNIKQAEAVIEDVAVALREAAAHPTMSPEGGQVEQLARELRSVKISVRFFRPGEQKVWGVLFWILAIGAGLTGLLSFVRGAGNI